MKKGARKFLKTAFFLVAIFLLFACGAIKQKREHFGTTAHFPVFAGPGDFFRSLARVSEIVFRKKLDGKPLDMKWITPAFREKLCLTVTLANHCVA